MIELEKMLAIIVKNFCNFDTYQIINILLILCNIYEVFINQDKFIFYIYNYINWDKFN